MDKPIYEYIRSAVQENGKLPDDFSMPDYSVFGKKIFAEGAADGTSMFHMSGTPDVHIENIKSAMLTYKKYPDSIVSEIENAFKKGKKSTLYIIDPLFEWLQTEQLFSADEIFSIAKALSENSSRSEVVKLGIVLFEAIDIENIPDVWEMLRVLSVCDEFTLFCCYVFRHYSNGNDEIFRAARLTEGWGRIFAVTDFLDPDTEEIRHWLLCCGCDNNIMYDYLALTVTKMIGLEDMVFEREPTDFSEEERRGIAFIVCGLISEGPCTGISGIEDPIGFLNRVSAILGGDRQEIPVSTALDLIAYYKSEN